MLAGRSMLLMTCACRIADLKRNIVMSLGRSEHFGAAACEIKDSHALLVNSADYRHLLMLQAVRRCRILVRNFRFALPKPQVSFLTSGGGTGGDNKDGSDGLDVKKLTSFFEKAEQIAKESAQAAVPPMQAESEPKQEEAQLELKPEKAEAQATSTMPKKADTQETDIRRRRISAPRLVPWTSNRFLKEVKCKKVVSNSPPKSFAKMFRESTFVQLGNFRQRELIGVVIENTNDTDLYIDFGGKFHAVCPQPQGHFYPRGSLVRIRLRDPEMANRFMINTKAISLHEADAVLLGPYRGQVVPQSEASLNSGFIPVTEESSSGFLPVRDNRNVVSSEHWKMSAAGDSKDDRARPPGFVEAVLKPSKSLPEGVSETVKGYDFNKGVDYEALLLSYATTGFQATNFGRAVKVINAMVSLHLRVLRD
ncbi:unnamed protein product [Dibothriocephalus latus]|uniref:Uncharacterized protein n=1 Tax=Dibothriocephalus latus TaxID=60516 RepID=A0A3P7LKJ2_DIBLA|nr:unnamed protein product [Dibothriocephalus latus]